MIKDYCKTGGYSCCTHWIGNIPIGDTLVSEYTLPGTEEYLIKNGQYVVKNGIYQMKYSAPVIAKLKPWEPKDNKQELLTKIWKVPGNMQLSEVIGQKAANGRGEFASPGWVIRTLMGPTAQERVPVIFYVVNDHQVAIPDAPTFHYEQER